jgi:hypothetical protein
MLIRIERYHGYQLALYREGNAYSVMISDSAGNLVPSSGFKHSGAENTLLEESALAEARRIVDTHRARPK